MNDIGRYRLVYPRLWRHPGFVALTKSGRELTLYLLTGPQTNRLGLFHLSVATAAEDLGVAVETIRKGLADVSATFGWTFDAAARVFYIPSWWRFNPPANPNVLRGNLKDLNDIAPCGLTEAFTRNVGTLPETFHQTFIEGCRQRMRQGSPNQYQDQYPKQKQEQPERASRAAANEEIPINDALLDVARETLKTINPREKDSDLLFDTFNWVLQGSKHREKLGAVKKFDALRALNHVLPERLARATVS